jgi:hypothetical protein
MREAAMMSESVSRPFESPKHVEVGRFRSERHSCSSEGGFAIESCSGKHGASEKVSNGFQEDFVTQSTDV